MSATLRNFNYLNALLVTGAFWILFKTIDFLFGILLQTAFAHDVGWIFSVPVTWVLGMIFLSIAWGSCSMWFFKNRRNTENSILTEGLLLGFLCPFVLTLINYIYYTLHTLASYLHNPYSYTISASLSWFLDIGFYFPFMLVSVVIAIYLRRRES